jgi:hypothetical protein
MDFMKTRLSLILFAATMLLVPPPLSAQTNGAPTHAPESDPFVKKDASPPMPASGPVGNLVFTVETYTTSQAEGAAILQGESSDQARYEHVLDLAKSGNATFDNLLAATCSPGNQAVIEGIDIMRFPIAFGGLETKAPWPSDLKARNLGWRLVYKAASVLNNQAADLVVFFEVTSLRSILLQHLSSGGTLPRPQFDTQRMNLKIIIPDGKTWFLGTMSPVPQETVADSKMTLVFGKMEFVALKSADGAKPSDGILENQFSLYSMDRDKAAEILRQKEEPGAVFAAVQRLVAGNEAKLEHVSVLRGIGYKENQDEIHEFMYPTTFSNAESVDQDVGYSVEAATKFIGNTSLVSVDLTKLQLLKNRGELNGRTVTNGYDASPLFELQSAVTNINAPLGENEFVGTISPPGDVGLLGLKPAGQVWLAFVKTTVANP